MSNYRVTGDKYEAVKGMRVVEIAKLIRADIKAAVVAGELPAGIKVSVRSDYNSIYLSITACPVNPINHQWAQLPEGDRWGYQTHGVERFTAEGARILGVLNAIHGAYNFDNSDSQSDYFHVNYYGRASWAGDFLSACQAAAAAHVPTTADLVAASAAAEARMVAENGELLAYLAQREAEIAAFQVEETARAEAVAAGEAVRAAALAAAGTREAAGPGSVYAVAITILWSESGAEGLHDGACYVSDFAGSAWGKVEAVLRAAALDAPDTGAYDKTKFRIDWSTGGTYEGRIDLQSVDADKAAPLAEHVRSFVEHAASEGAVYGLSDDERAGWARLLDTHIIGAELPAAVEAAHLEAYKAKVRAEVAAEIGNAPTLGTIVPFRPRTLAPVVVVAGPDLAPVVAGPAKRVANEAAACWDFLLGL